MDDKLTTAIQEFLDTPRDERDVPAGAEMLLQLNRNQILYQNILRNPENLADTLEYELQKYLKIRLDGYTMHEVAVMNETVVPAALETLQAGAPDGGEDTPAENAGEDTTAQDQNSEDNSAPDINVASKTSPEFADAPAIDADNDHGMTAAVRGLRPDHDQLPAEIQELVAKNRDRFFRIKHIYNQLLTMEEACVSDRYELLQQLKELDTQYRADWQKYDGFVIGTPISEEEQAAVDANTISAARKYLSSNLPKLDALKDEPEKAEALLAKMQERVDLLNRAKATFDAEYRERLEAAGLSFE